MLGEPRDTITLKGMRFHALIGVLPHEEHVAQPLEIDLTVELDADRSSEIVDYSQLYDVADRVISAGHVGYLEDVAERVAGEALEIDGVSVARVAVRKPHVALRGPLAYAEVTITRTREA
jgi:dihydroneopterin aldolase